MLQMIILPRQARDKHTVGKPQNREARFLAVHGGQDQRQDHPLAAVGVASLPRQALDSTARTQSALLPPVRWLRCGVETRCVQHPSAAVRRRALQQRNLIDALLPPPVLSADILKISSPQGLPTP
jgi:hypothetical protein